MGTFFSPAEFSSVDPRWIAPDPGVMGELYCDEDLRAQYPDGMSLACARPQELTYQQLTALYAGERNKPGFSPVAFWDTHFETPAPDVEEFTAPEGMVLTDEHGPENDYIQWLRPKFIHASVEPDGSFDIWLPNKRSVAGAGRFGKHSFLWDGYQMAKGYEADGRWDLIMNMAYNIEYQINKYGYALNGSADFYATRSQPPYFSNLVSMLAEKFGPEALVRFLPAMEKEYQSYWMEGQDKLAAQPDDGKVHGHRTLVRLPLGNGKFAYLNRYWDDADGPRLESYKEDMELGELVTRGLSGTAKDKRLQKLYKDIRAAAASGWDFSSRWFEDGSDLATINTTEILPVDLNSLLARTEQVLAEAHMATGNPEKAQEYLEKAKDRVRAINWAHWDPDTRIYRDYNFVQERQTSIISAAMVYPMYVGITDPEQSMGVADMIEGEMLYEGGIVATTTVDSTQQWDGGKDGKGQMNKWDPYSWAAERGFVREAYMFETEKVSPAVVARLLELGKKLRAANIHGKQVVFKEHRILPEKIRAHAPADLAGGGEYALQKVLAMSAETFRAEQKWDTDRPEGTLPLGLKRLERMGRLARLAAA